jgi:hypothetical protein
MSVYPSLHVSGDYVPITRTDNCVYVTLVILKQVDSLKLQIKLHIKLSACFRITSTKCCVNTVFPIHGPVHRESNSITVQQDATYSVYYISVGSSTRFGCQHPPSEARTAVITASGID